MARMTLPELEALIDEHVPHWRAFSRITALGERTMTMVMPFRPEHARVGGTISGPALMLLADRTAYFLTLALVGPVLAAVTSNLDIHFLARPEPRDVTAIATMLRIGARTAVSTIDLHAHDTLVAHATVTYALPAQAS